MHAAALTEGPIGLEHPLQQRPTLTGDALDEVAAATGARTPLLAHGGLAGEDYDEPNALDPQIYAWLVTP